MTENQSPAPLKGSAVEQSYAYCASLTRCSVPTLFKNRGGGTPTMPPVKGLRPLDPRSARRFMLWWWLDGYAEFG